MKKIAGDRGRTLPWMAAPVLFLSVVVALSMAVLSSMSKGTSPEEHLQNPPAPTGALTLTTHDTILIHGNSDFTNASGVVWGSGTESDPYVIENWNVNASTADGIRVWDTDAYFVIRNCNVHDGGSNYCGIRMENSSNGVVVNNTCSNNLWGVYIYLSDNNEVSNNTCSNSDAGVRIYLTTRSTVKDNTCLNNQIGVILFYPTDGTVTGNNCSSSDDYGIYVQSSDNSIFSNNDCSSNLGYGMYMSVSSNTTLSNNTFRSNSEYGVMLYSTRNITFINNTISGNAQYGLYLYGETNSTDNWIWNNTFYHNNGADDAYDPLHIQAYDNGTDNRWNSTDGYGNFWSDWTTPDLDGDGIVEGPYLIAGDAGAEDDSPQTKVQTPIPEFGTISVAAMAVLMTILQTRKTSRRKET